MAHDGKAQELILPIESIFETSTMNLDDIHITCRFWQEILDKEEIRSCGECMVRLLCIAAESILS